MLRPLLTAALVMPILLAIQVDSEAGWKKRGWYVKKPTANCVMRKVAVVDGYGRISKRMVRVCR
jgi:hypothetical protein